MFFIPKLLCLCNFRLSDGIVSFDFFSRQFAGRFFFRGVEIVGAMVANPAQMTSCRAVCRRRMQGEWIV